MYVALRATEAIRVTWSDLLLRCSDSRLSGRRFWSSVDGCEREPVRILSEAGFSPGGHLLCSACCRMTENKTKKTKKKCESAAAPSVSFGAHARQRRVDRDTLRLHS